MYPIFYLLKGDSMVQEEASGHLDCKERGGPRSGSLKCWGQGQGFLIKAEMQHPKPRLGPVRSVILHIRTPPTLRSWAVSCFLLGIVKETCLRPLHEKPGRTYVHASAGSGIVLIVRSSRWLRYCLFIWRVECPPMQPIMASIGP